MRKIKPAVALEMSIFDLAIKLKWNYQTVLMMIRWGSKLFTGCETCKKQEACLNSKHGFNKRNACLIEKMTLRNVIHALEDEYVRSTSSLFSSNNRNVLRVLARIGLTRLDSIALLQETVSIEDLKRMPKNKLLNLDMRLLGIMQEYIANRYRIGPNGSPATIRDVLEGRLVGLTQQTESELREILRQLDFGCEDWVFMYGMTKYRLYIKYLMKDGDVSEELAHQIAEKLGFIRF